VLAAKLRGDSSRSSSESCSSDFTVAKSSADPSSQMPRDALSTGWEVFKVVLPVTEGTFDEYI
jgi:hypothetical protein